MSLQQLLQGYSQEISANTEHQNEMMDNVRDRKANTLEEQFNHHLETISSAATELGTASGAFHLGRKIYKKYTANQAKRAKLQKAKDEANDNAGADDSGPSGSQRPPEAPSGEEGSAPKAGAEPAASEPKPPTRAAAQESENGGADEGNSGGGEAEGAAGEAEEGAQETGSLSQKISAAQQRFRNLKARVQGGDAAVAEEPSGPGTSGGKFTRSAVRDAQGRTGTNQGDVLTQEGPESAQAPAGEAAPAQPAAAPEPTAPEPTVRQPTQIGDAPAEVAEDARPGMNQPFSENTGRPVRSEFTRNAPEDSGESIRPPDAGPSGPSAGGTEASGAEIGGEGGEEGANFISRGAARVAGLGGDAANLLKSGAKKAAAKVGENLGIDGLSEGLETAGSFALDAIPVVGEIAGVVTGLVALFKGLDHKDDPDKEDSLSNAVAGPVAAGIDPTSLTKSAPAQTTIV